MDGTYHHAVGSTWRILYTEQSVLAKLFAPRVQRGQRFLDQDRGARSHKVKIGLQRRHVHRKSCFRTDGLPGPGRQFRSTRSRCPRRLRHFLWHRRRNEDANGRDIVRRAGTVSASVRIRDGPGPRKCPRLHTHFRVVVHNVVAIESLNENPMVSGRENHVRVAASGCVLAKVEAWECAKRAVMVTKDIARRDLAQSVVEPRCRR
jgi:hypothetical protein